MKPTVFVSYSPKDETWVDKLECHLGIAKRYGNVDVWDVRRIQPGEVRPDEILKAINKATIAVLLVSAEYLISQPIGELEVKPVLQRRDCDGLIVLPVIVKPCGWEQVPWLNGLEVRPKHRRPLSAGKENEIDADLTEIAGEIEIIAKRTGSSLALRYLPQIRILAQELSEDSYSSPAQNSASGEPPSLPPPPPQEFPPPPPQEPPFEAPALPVPYFKEKEKVFDFAHKDLLTCRGTHAGKISEPVNIWIVTLTKSLKRMDTPSIIKSINRLERLKSAMYVEGRELERARIELECGCGYRKLGNRNRARKRARPRHFSRHSIPKRPSRPLLPSLPQRLKPRPRDRSCRCGWPPAF